jgi:hypothetical protein
MGFITQDVKIASSLAVTGITALPKKMKKRG